MKANIGSPSLLFLLGTVLTKTVVVLTSATLAGVVLTSATLAGVVLTATTLFRVARTIAPAFGRRDVINLSPTSIRVDYDVLSGGLASEDECRGSPTVSLADVPVQATEG